MCRRVAIVLVCSLFISPRFALAAAAAQSTQADFVDGPAWDVLQETSTDGAVLLGEATGADLMAYGIRLLQSPTSASHLLTLVPES